MFYFYSSSWKPPVPPLVIMIVDGYITKPTGSAPVQT